MQKYSLLMLDLDGTTIPNHQDGLPSKNVREAIHKAHTIIHIGLATSRPFAYAQHIIQHLDLSALCVLDGGAQLYDPVAKKIIWEQEIEQKDAQVVWDFLRTNNYKFRYSDGSSQKQVAQELLPPKILDFIVLALSPKQADHLVTELSHIPTLALHKVTSWTQGELGVKISHVTATKLHGINTIAEKFGVKREEIIGVGDSYNDFPLLMASGLKVAMGNAIPELKAIADYIAPSVEEDGLVKVIETFILNPSQN